MTDRMENIVENIDFSMKMEDMPLTDDDKNRLRQCLNGTIDIKKMLEDVIKNIHLRKLNNGQI